MTLQQAAQALMGAVKIDRHDTEDWPETSRKAFDELRKALADEQAQEPVSANHRTTGWVAPVDRYAVPVLFNPYTGEPRDVRDVQSDPQGVLIVPPGKAEMLAAKPTVESVTDCMMNLVDRLGHEASDVDARAWEHLLVYAPKQAQAVEPVATTMAAHIKNECGYCEFHAVVPNGTKLYIHPPPAPYDQQALELCDMCGWKAIMPGEPCFVCNMKTEAQQVAAPVALAAWLQWCLDNCDDSPEYNFGTTATEHMRALLAGFPAPMPPTQGAKP